MPLMDKIKKEGVSQGSVRPKPNYDGKPGRCNGKAKPLTRGERLI